ncbi:HK97 gp10 family phage protein [Ochrobactrum sp. Marseille-Q0166]|uniref:HK97 gp10 family phage protein n=1 Tax=Ochrobactrum sp. Marseille-Q0166 TaxID=2761105 RepID=UPI001655DF10|nr:HK97 gp10 family phage protein [Ochrobactrum sp. Marseille-Q0166]MBC8718166.1 hypothetical protein [Ochrobactrum sp. Marseille-Q0166]
MVLRAKLLGRVELMNKIRKIAPKAIEKMDEVKLQVGEEAAAAIKARAPRLSGDYAESIHAGLQSDNPDKIVFGAKKSKDPNAVGAIVVHYLSVMARLAVWIACLGRYHIHRRDGGLFRMRRPFQAVLLTVLCRRHQPGGGGAQFCAYLPNTRTESATG